MGRTRRCCGGFGADWAKEAVLLAGFLKVVRSGLAMAAQGDLVFSFFIGWAA